MKIGSKLKSTAGFTLAEIIAVVVVIAILGGLAIGVVANLTTQAKLNSKVANAATLSAMVSQVQAAGGTIAAGATNNIDSTSVTTAIGSLNTAFTLNGLTFGMNPKIANPVSYILTGTAPNIIFLSDGLTTTNP